MRAIRPEPATDISGAVALAADVARLVSGLKVLIVLSDFQEELPRGHKPTPFRLSSERVVMLYRPDVRDTPSGDEMYQRLQDWERRLKAAGASTVCRVPIKGVLAESIRACFSS